MTDERLLQSLNGLCPMLSIPCGSVMLVKALQYENAFFPMLFTPCGSVMLVKALQL